MKRLSLVLCVGLLSAARIAMSQNSEPVTSSTEVTKEKRSPPPSVCPLWETDFDNGDYFYIAEHYPNSGDCVNSYTTGIWGQFYAPMFCDSSEGCLSEDALDKTKWRTKSGDQFDAEPYPGHQQTVGSDHDHLRSLPRGRSRDLALLKWPRAKHWKVTANGQPSKVFSLQWYEVLTGVDEKRSFLFGIEVTEPRVSFTEEFNGDQVEFLDAKGEQTEEPTNVIRLTADDLGRTGEGHAILVLKKPMDSGRSDRK